MDPSVANFPGMFLELEKQNLCLPCEWAGQALPCVPGRLGLDAMDRLATSLGELTFMWIFMGIHGD